MKPFLANKQTWIITLILITGVVISAYLLEKGQQRLVPPVKQSLLQHRQFFMLNVHSYKTDPKTGKLAMILQAPRVTRGADANHYHIKQPTVTKLTQGQAPTYIRSHYATTSLKFDVIDLIGHVKIDQAASHTHPRNKVRTSHLRYLPNKNVASSDKFVTLWQGMNKISGTGLRADLNHNNLSLLHNVQGEYITDANS